jgi:hypothetical protein
MSASRVEISCIKGKCCCPSTSTEFDSTRPAELNGLISPEEFQASIGRINASLVRPKWTYRVQTAGRIFIVFGLVLLLFAGGKYLHMKFHHHRHHGEHPVPVDPTDPSTTGVNQPVQFAIDQPIDVPSLPMPVDEGDDILIQKEEEQHEMREKEDDDDDDKKMAAAAASGRGAGCKGKKHRKCIKHLFHSGLISLVLGFVLCRWIANRKMRQLITRVVPAICAEHHLYTSASRPVPVSWSLEERSICRYNCKNNRLKLVLDLHSLVPLSRMDMKEVGSKVEKQQMISPSSYVPLATNETA